MLFKFFSEANNDFIEKYIDDCDFELFNHHEHVFSKTKAQLIIGSLMLYTYLTMIPLIVSQIYLTTKLFTLNVNGTMIDGL